MKDKKKKKCKECGWELPEHRVFCSKDKKQTSDGKWVKKDEGRI